MSIEKALAENTEALRDNTEALRQFASNGNGGATAGVAVESEKKTTKPESKKEAKTESKDADAIPYDNVKAKTLELVKAKGRDSVAAILKEFGKDYASAKDLKAEQYADYIKAVDKELAEDDVA